VPVTVYLDTSFLMLSAKFHTDVLSEAEALLGGRVGFAVPAPVLAELRKLSKRRGASGRDARIALNLIHERSIPCLSSSKGSQADQALIEASKLPKSIVATADLGLRRKVRSLGKPVILFREKAKLELEGIEAAYW
jgi:rRNA-processing protein FCF1